MEPLYSETYLHAKAPAKRVLIRVLLIVLAAFCIALGVLAALVVGTFLVFIVLALIAAIIIFLLPTTNIAYEYIFVDGQIDFDRILKGEKRKTMKRIDMVKVEVIAPENSHALDSYKQHPLFDFSSGMPGDKNYIAVSQGEKGVERILFTPDEKMLEMIGRKSPSKLKSE